jgi:hypothetical protein
MGLLDDILGSFKPKVVDSSGKRLNTLEFDTQITRQPFSDEYWQVLIDNGYVNLTALMFGEDIYSQSTMCGYLTIITRDELVSLGYLEALTEEEK